MDLPSNCYHNAPCTHLTPRICIPGIQLSPVLESMLTWHSWPGSGPSFAPPGLDWLQRMSWRSLCQGPASSAGLRVWAAQSAAPAFSAQPPAAPALPPAPAAASRKSNTPAEALIQEPGWVCPLCERPGTAYTVISSGSDCHTTCCAS